MSPEAPTDSPPPAALSTEPPNGELVFPTTVGQKRFWSLDGLLPGNPALNMPIAARLVGTVDRRALQLSLDEVLRKHETLRCRFETESEELVQVVLEPRPVEVRWIDCTATPSDAVQARIEAVKLEEGSRSFELAKGPFLRAALTTFTPTEHVLMLTMHHIVSDGWSNGILLRELAENYTRIINGETPPFEDLPLQYADFAVWQQTWLKGPESAAQKKYWADHIGEEIPALNLPTDRPRGRKATINGTIISKLLPPGLSEEFRLACQRENATPFMGYLAAYVLLLHRYSGKSEFVVGSPAACRNQTELEGMIGLFANPILFRPCIEADMTFRRLLQHVRDATVTNFSNQEYPFELLSETLRTEETRRGVPWLQAYFIFQKAFLQPQKMPDLDLTPLRSISPGAIFEWMLGIVERSEGVRLQLEYNTDLFDPHTTEHALRHLETIISGASRNIDFVIAEFDLDEAAVHELSPHDHTTARWQPGPAARTPRIASSTPYFVLPDGLQSRLVDRLGRRAPNGVPGRLILAESATREARDTGDWFRWRPDGTYEWLGCDDDLARSRGFTLELAQVGAVARGVTGVESALAVIARDQAPGSMILHVVPRHGERVTIEQLRDQLDGRLPAYMQPAAIVLRAQWPLTHEGAIDFVVLRKATGLEAASKAPSTECSNRPADEIEAGLAAIFAELLRVPAVDVTSSFFDLGGHSILGVKLFARIEQTFKQRLPLATLLSTSSVRALAQRLRQADTSVKRWSSLVPMQAAGAGPKFFCIHGAGGNVLLYRDLARRIAPRARFYGLQAQGFDGQSPCLTSIEGMAARYLEEIRAEQPHGPYFVGGYCMGGNVAYEIARLLRRDGEAVALVALLDTYNLRRSLYSGSTLDRLRIWAQKSGFHIDTLLRLSMLERQAYVREKWRMLRELLHGQWRTITRKGSFTNGDDTRRRLVMNVQNANHLALRAHDPQPLTCDLTLFAPRINYHTFPDPLMGWGDLVKGRLEVVRLRANPHAMLLEPFVRDLADRLCENIQNAANRAGR